MNNWFFKAENLRILLDAICELGKFEAREETLLIENLTLIFKLCSVDALGLNDRARSDDENKEDYLTQYFVYKKARSIYTHEKFHVQNETARRSMFYNFVLNLLAEQTEPNQHIPLTTEICQTISKQLTKDRKQKF